VVHDAVVIRIATAFVRAGSASFGVIAVAVARSSSLGLVLDWATMLGAVRRGAVLIASGRPSGRALE